MNLSRHRKIALRVVQGAAFAGLGAYAAQSTMHFCGSGADGFFETWVYDALILAAAGLCIVRAVFFLAQRAAWLVLNTKLLL